MGNEVAPTQFSKDVSHASILAEALAFTQNRTASTSKNNLYIFILVLYNSNMTAIFSVTEARENIAEMIVRSSVEEVFIKRHGEEVAVVISPAVWYSLCEAYEDLSDYTAALEVLNDPDEIDALADVKRELGLV